MANTLYVSTIEKVSGAPVDLTGQSAAKAWVNFNASTAARDSLNISSMTDAGTGLPQMNFSASLASADYALGGSASTDGADASSYTFSHRWDDGAQVAPTTGYCDMLIQNGALRRDPVYANAIVHGDLA